MGCVLAAECLCSTLETNSNLMVWKESPLPGARGRNRPRWPLGLFADFQKKRGRAWIPSWSVATRPAKGSSPQYPVSVLGKVCEIIPCYYHLSGIKTSSRCLVLPRLNSCRRGWFASRVSGRSANDRRAEAERGLWSQAFLDYCIFFFKEDRSFGQQLWHQLPERVWEIVFPVLKAGQRGT